MTHVHTVDIAAHKAQQTGVIRNREIVEGLVASAKLAGPSETGAQSIASFEPKANHRLEHSYYSVKGGDEPKYSLDNLDEAKSTGSDMVSRLQKYADAINKYGGGDLTPGGAYTPYVAVEDQFNDMMTFFEMRNKDNVEAARMQLVVDAAIVKNTFGVEGDVFDVKDGQVVINAFDMKYDGDNILRSFGGGLTGDYRADGSITVDKRV